MKKTNKGFSMVELIIVIAIMAILAGALAPALIKYINKSRISTDIQTANTIATAVQTALSDENGYDDAVSYETSGSKSATKDDAKAYSTINDNSDAFATAVKNTVGSAPSMKSKKCMAGNTTSNDTSKDFFVYVNRSENLVAVFDPSGHELYPSASACLTSDDSASKSGCPAKTVGN